MLRGDILHKINGMHTESQSFDAIVAGPPVLALLAVALLAVARIDVARIGVARIGVVAWIGVARIGVVRRADRLRSRIGAQTPAIALRRARF